MGVLGYPAQCDPTCEEGVEMPQVKFGCVLKPRESEFGFLYLSVPDPADPTKPKIYNPDFMDVATDALFVPPYGVKLIGIGDMPLPEKDSAVGSLRRPIKKNKKYTINFTVDELSDETYDWILKTACMGVLFAWPATLGGKYLGDAKGIKVSIDADPVFERGENTYERAEIVLSFDADAAPVRGDHYYATSGTPESL